MLELQVNDSQERLRAVWDRSRALFPVRKVYDLHILIPDADVDTTDDYLFVREGFFSPAQDRLRHRRLW